MSPLLAKVASVPEVTNGLVLAQTNVPGADTNGLFQRNVILGILGAILGIVFCAIAITLALRHRKADSAEVTNSAVVLTFALAIFAVGVGVTGYAVWAGGVLSAVLGV